MSVRIGGIGKLKSRTGCKTCKIRRVKCGEEKPRCVRCSSTGRRCEYDSGREHHSVVPRALPASSPVYRERRAFEYYFFHAAPSISDALDLDFWRGAVLQVCGTEPAVWDAIVALSTFYEHPPPVGRSSTYHVEHSDHLPPPRSQSHRDALVWYSRSLRRLQQQIQRGLTDLTVALVSCALYLCIEVIQGNIKAALTLYRQGAELMASATETTARLTWVKETIAPIILRLGTLAVVIDGVAPLPGRPHIPRRLEYQFTSLADARTALHTLVSDWKVFDCDCAAVRLGKFPPKLDTLSHLGIRQQELEGSLLSWHRRFCGLSEVVRYKESRLKMATSDHQGIIAALLMTYTSVLILARTGLATAEAAYDAHEDDFTEIVTHSLAAVAATAVKNGDQPPFVFDMDVGMPLFITILKCRLPSLRRQALRLLYQAPPLQGMWVCRSAAGFLAAIVAVEERGACSQPELSLAMLLDQPGRVPFDYERVFSLQLVPHRTDEGEMRTALQYSRREVVDGELQILDEIVILPARSPHKTLSIL